MTMPDYADMPQALGRLGVPLDHPCQQAVERLALVRERIELAPEEYGEQVAKAARQVDREWQALEVVS
ncbi:MAG: hypothetical protein R3215_00230 [Halomonas sp.]|nr:hypothetical protein [Halomonas sp.]